MSRTKIALLCVPVAVAGLAVAVHASVRVSRHEGDLATLAIAGREEGRSFEATLHGEHAERQRVIFDQRRKVALSLAAARRDRLVALLVTAAAGLAAAALTVMSRIAAEIDEDRRHLSAQAGDRGPDRS